ncbi:DinB family protein [Sulfitobacter guttiformis]|uniref:Putative damage-inducible protein DinB n=1 Tax=Sulfitobacter guttiformis TaxID=74349 RepID=A0A420DHQ5_9RHOB|nr:DinB family protein [Sulfitobacter guttiformis]KIN72518.1 DinB protein [Sulfitobacter guttiformis KCTC 32187]RKE93735.1 putative damage-inducible protein DinB [Sulfitobacter guttiformis]
MIAKEYVLQMARYNAWQNSQLRKVVKQMDEADLTADRGAPFGSIFGTMNHILWSDMNWMGHWCSDVPSPAVPKAASATLTPTYGVWDAERFRLDGRICIWAQTLSNVDLQGMQSCSSGENKQQISRSVGVCVTDMFNSQTYHRGQISQMLSGAGITLPVSDLMFLPEDA